MILQRVLPFAHSLLKSVVKEGDIVIDATVGNGHDTLLLANLVGEHGFVYGFDIQEQAIINTYKRLQEHKLEERVQLFLKSHAEINTMIHQHHHGNITAAIFNLGYLPGGDKSIVTTPTSTIQAVKQLLSLLHPGGMIVLVIYHGHPEGAIERDALLAYVSTLDQKNVQVLQYKFLNQKNHAPFVIAMEKLN